MRHAPKARFQMWAERLAAAGMPLARPHQTAEMIAARDAMRSVGRSAQEKFLDWAGVR